MAIAAALAALLVANAPAGAIETTTFGIDVVDGSADGRLHIPLRAGETTAGRLLVWNKTDSPVRLRLSVAAARVDRNGAAQLGGDEEPVGWVHVDPDEPELGPQERREVHVDVVAPRELDGETKTVAVLAELTATGDAPAVLQRLAVTTFLEPDRDSLVASLGWLPYAGGLLLLLVVAAIMRRVMSRRSALSS